MKKIVLAKSHVQFSIGVQHRRILPSSPSRVTMMLDRGFSTRKKIVKRRNLWDLQKSLW